MQTKFLFEILNSFFFFIKLITVINKEHTIYFAVKFLTKILSNRN